MNLIIAAVLIISINPGMKIGQLLAWEALTVLIIVIIMAPILANSVLLKISFNSKRLSWVHSKLSEVIEISIKNIKDVSFLFKIFCIGMLLFIRTCVLFSIYFLFFNVNVDLPALALFYALFKLGTFIVLTPGNIGVQEVAWGILSEIMGIGMAQGVLVSVFIRVVATCSIFVLGITLGGMDLLQHRNEYTKNIDETTNTSLPPL